MLGVPVLSRLVVTKWLLANKQPNAIGMEDATKGKKEKA